MPQMYVLWLLVRTENLNSGPIRKHRLKILKESGAFWSQFRVSLSSWSWIIEPGVWSFPPRLCFTNQKDLACNRCASGCLFSVLRAKKSCWRTCCLELTKAWVICVAEQISHLCLYKVEKGTGWGWGNALADTNAPGEARAPWEVGTGCQVHSYWVLGHYRPPKWHISLEPYNLLTPAYDTEHFGSQSALSSTSCCFYLCALFLVFKGLHGHFY